MFTCKDCVYYLSKSDSCSLQLAADSNNPLIPYKCGNFEETYEIGTEDPLNSHIHQQLREEKAQILAKIIQHNLPLIQFIKMQYGMEQ